MEGTITTYKVMHIFLWEKEKNDNCENTFVTKEYVYKTYPNLDFIEKLIENKNIWILIGKNPSKSTGILMDETNVYLRNKLVTEKNADGYLLLNLFPDIETKYNISFKNTDICNLSNIIRVLNRFKNNNILIFYGADVVSKLNTIEKFRTIPEYKNLFETIAKRNNVYYTGTSGYFGHPASRFLKGNWEIYKLENNSNIKWKPF